MRGGDIGARSGHFAGSPGTGSEAEASTVDGADPAPVDGVNGTASLTEHPRDGAGVVWDGAGVV